MGLLFYNPVEMPIINFMYQINRTANLFHFVSNLTDWHFSMRKSYREEWMNETGPLGNSEEQALKELVILFKKYNFGENYWGKVFLNTPDQKVWQIAKKTFWGDADKFKKLIHIIDPRFEKIWQKDEPKLNYWRDELKNTEKYLPSAKIVDDLNVLFGSQVNEDATININLLLSSSFGCGGGASTSNRSIEIELSRMPLNRFKNIWSIIWHELIHKLWQRQEYNQLIREYCFKINLESPVKNIPENVIVNEMVINSLLPWGYLRKKYFGDNTDEYLIPRIKDLLEITEENRRIKLNDLAAYYLAPIIADYIANKRKMDSNFLEKSVALMDKIR